VLRLRTATVASRSTTTGRVSIVLSQATIDDVPALGNAVFAVGTIVQVLSYRGSLLIIGASSVATAQPVEATGTTSNGTTISTSYTNSLSSTGIHGVVFIAPASGIVQILGRASGGSGSVGQYAQLDYEVRQGDTIGSGSVVRATSNNTASVFLSSTSGGQGPLNVSGLVTGLTPGAVYNACLTYASSSGASTASFNRRYIMVKPL
jgi:hypothetical protein